MLWNVSRSLSATGKTSTHVLQAYVQKMAHSLLDISDNQESLSTLDIQRYSLEMAAVFVCAWNSMAHKAVLDFKDNLNGQVNFLGQEGLPDSLYQNLLVWLGCRLMLDFQNLEHACTEVFYVVSRHCQMLPHRSLLADTCVTPQICTSRNTGLL